MLRLFQVLLACLLLTTSRVPSRPARDLEDGVSQLGGLEQPNFVKGESVDDEQENSRCGGFANPGH